MSEKDPGRNGPKDRAGSRMTRFAIHADVALRLAERGEAPAAAHALVAPTTLRTEALSTLYRACRAGTITKKDAIARMDAIRALKVRLLGDRVSQRHAWDIAAELGWDDIGPAEYLAVARLQADAFVTLDEGLAATAARLGPVAPYAALLQP